MINKIKHGVSVKCWPERRVFLMDVYMYGAEQKLKGFRVMEACTARLGIGEKLHKGSGVKEEKKLKGFRVMEACTARLGIGEKLHKGSGVKEEKKSKVFRVMEACTARLEGERFANGCSARFAVCRDGEGVAVNLNAEYLAA